MHAVSRGDPEIVKVLLAHGANPNSREDKAGFRLLPLQPKLEVNLQAESR